MGISSKTGCRFQLVYARGMVKFCLDGKLYLVILRQAFFNPNSDNTLFAEDQIKCYGVRVYSRPRFLGGKQLVEARYHVGHSVKLGISWYRSTRYLDVSQLTRVDIYRLGFLQLVCGELYSPYSPFFKSTRQFKLDKPCLDTGKVKIVLTNEKIQE